MSTAQRLCLYVAAAPAVIGARRLGAGEMGIGRNGVEWWVASVPGRDQMVTWNDRGEALLSNPSGAAARRVVIGAVAAALSFLPFARLAGPRAIIPALLVGVAAAFLAGRVAPRWVLFGDTTDSAAAMAVIEILVGEYERGVR